MMMFLDDHDDDDDNYDENIFHFQCCRLCRLR